MLEVAFKTGTSYGFRDAWSLGVSNGYAIGVWVGRPDGAPRPAHLLRCSFANSIEAFDLLGGAIDNTHAPERREGPAAPALTHLEPNGGNDLAILFPPSNTQVLVLDYGPNSRGLSRSRRARGMRRSPGTPKASV